MLNILEAGDLHPEPTATRFGVHIIRMDEKADGDILPFDAVKPPITEKLEQAAWAKAAQMLTRDLVANATIERVNLMAA